MNYSEFLGAECEKAKIKIKYLFLLYQIHWTVKRSLGIISTDNFMKRENNRTHGNQGNVMNTQTQYSLAPRIFAIGFNVSKVYKS